MDPLLALQQSAGNRTVTALVGVLSRQPTTDAGAPPAAAPTDAGAPPAPGGETIDFDGVTLATTADGVRKQLEDEVKARGLDAPQKLVDDVERKLANLDSTSGVPAGKEDALAKKERVRNEILPLLRQQVAKVREEADQAVKDFVVAARAQIDRLLDDSEKRTNAERVRYGIQDLGPRQTTPGAGSDALAGPAEHAFSMENTGAAKKLAEGAKTLLARRKEINELKAKQDEIRARRPVGDLPPGGVPTGNDAIEFEALQRELDQVREQINERERDYDTLLSPLQAEFPVLASATQNRENTAELEVLAQGNTAASATMIGLRINKTLEDIEKVRAANKSGDVDVFKLTKVVDLTKAAQNFTPGSIPERAVEAHVTTLKEIEGPAALALAVLNLALLALAPVTGGATLLVVAGISGATALEHLKEYEVERAMTGTDLDKAKALSREEPELLWLALDVVFAAADIGAGANAAAKLIGRFAALRPKGLAVVSARTAKELEEATKALEEAARATEGGERLAAQLRKDAEKASKVAGKEGELAKDLDRVGAAGRAAEAELKGGVQAATEGGHVHVTEDGRIFSCENPCLDPRDRFRDVLGSSRELEAELAGLEKRAVQRGGREEFAKEVAAFDNRLFAAATKSRAERILAALPTLAERFPILKELSLDAEAINRIIRKRNLNSLKGQLFEELVSRRVSGMMADEAGRKLLGIPGGAKVEFIPGDRVRAVSTNARGGRSVTQFSDGLVVIRGADGKVERIVTVIEAKAGGFSAEKLIAQETSLKKLSRGAARERRLEAIEEFRKRRIGDPEVAGQSLEALDDKFEDKINEIVKELNDAEAGQVRKDIERLDQIQIQERPPGSDEFRNIDRAGSVRDTKIVGFVPSDVDAASLTKRGQAETKLKGAFEATQLGVDSEGVTGLAEEFLQRSRNQIQ